jgi:hypothetical protein
LFCVIKLFWELLLFEGVIRSQAIVDQNEPDLEDIVKPSENELAMRHQVAKTRKPVQILLPSLFQVCLLVTSFLVMLILPINDLL